MLPRGWKGLALLGSLGLAPFRAACRNRRSHYYALTCPLLLHSRDGPSRAVTCSSARSLPVTFSEGLSAQAGLAHALGFVPTSTHSRLQESCKQKIETEDSQDFLRHLCPLYCGRHQLWGGVASTSKCRPWPRHYRYHSQTQRAGISPSPVA